jgi:hypothetical protein
MYQQQVIKDQIILRDLIGRHEHHINYNVSQLNYATFPPRLFFFWIEWSSFSLRGFSRSPDSKPNVNEKTFSRTGRMKPIEYQCTALFLARTYGWTDLHGSPS